jgi:RND family efflux transporter MFP subunit
MNDKSALLGQLKIDRGAAPAGGSGGALKWVLILLVLACLGVAGLYGWKQFTAGVPIKTATALPMATGAGAAGGSVLDATGYVVARRQATVSSKVTGKIVELNVEEGQHVKSGQVLARIDDTNARTQLELAKSQLDAARSALAEVRVNLADAERTYKRNKNLAEQKLVSQQQLDTSQANFESLGARLESTQRSVDVAQRGVNVQQQLLTDTIVRAPFDGVITVKNAQIGEMISPLSAGGAGTRTGVGTLVDMDSLEIEVEVNENFINRVTSGQKVDAVLNAYPDWKIPARVIAVIPTADRSKATVKVRIGLEVKDPRILPDMGVRTSFLTEEKPAGGEQAVAPPKGVVIPAAAVRDDSGAKVVFVVKGETVERRAITAGPARGDQLVIEGGLSAGEAVALGDLAKLSDGAKVKVEKE